MASRDQMRAADVDRERFAQRVRQGLEEGRLSLDELDDRLRLIYEAKTFGDLDRLVADLPVPAAVENSQLAPAPAQVPPSRVEENPKLPGWLSMSWRLWLVAVTVNLVIWFLTSLTSGGLEYFWPMWVAGPWAVANVGLMVLFPPNRRGS